MLPTVPARFICVCGIIIMTALAVGTAHGAGNKAPAFRWQSRV
jgi:hypothetical protein